MNNEREKLIKNRIQKCLMEESYRYEEITEASIKFTFNKKKLNNMIIHFPYKLWGEKVVFKLEINIHMFEQRTIRGIILKFEQFNSIKRMEIELRELRKKLKFAKAHFIRY